MIYFCYVVFGWLVIQCGFTIDQSQKAQHGTTFKYNPVGDLIWCELPTLIVIAWLIWGQS